MSWAVYFIFLFLIRMRAFRSLRTLTQAKKLMDWSTNIILKSLLPSSECFCLLNELFSINNVQIINKWVSKQSDNIDWQILILFIILYTFSLKEWWLAVSVTWISLGHVQILVDFVSTTTGELTWLEILDKITSCCWCMMEMASLNCRTSYEIALFT